MNENVFKKSHTLEEMQNESSRIRSKYPDRIPIIVERAKGSNISDIDKNKYLCPVDLSIHAFMYTIRKRINIKSEQAIFLFIQGKLHPSNITMGDLYNDYVDETGFLFCVYSGENAFGS
jgi:GABA(A) receptor-associated protein